MLCVTYGSDTNCIAVEKKNSMCQAIPFLYYVEWMRAIEVGMCLQTIIKREVTFSCISVNIQKLIN